MYLLSICQVQASVEGKEKFMKKCLHLKTCSVVSVYLTVKNENKNTCFVWVFELNIWGAPIHPLENQGGHAQTTEPLLTWAP